MQPPTELQLQLQSPRRPGTRLDLDQLEEDVRFYFGSALAPSTKRTYQSAKNRYMDFCRKRFTPVFLQSVQSSRFHERKQLTMETVDGYAHELKRLFYPAYPTTYNREAQRRKRWEGQSYTASSWQGCGQTSRPIKVAGVDGNFDQLLTNARFKEARLRDVIGPARSSQGTATPWSSPQVETPDT